MTPPVKMAKEPRNFRLSALARRQLSQLAAAWEIAQVDALERAIDRAHVARFGEQAPQDGAELAEPLKK